jgi:hypothetical protein
MARTDSERDFLGGSVAEAPREGSCQVDSRFAGHSKVATTRDRYVGEWGKRRANDSGERLAAIYAEAQE